MECQLLAGLRGSWWYPIAANRKSPIVTLLSAGGCEGKTNIQDELMKLLYVVKWNFIISYIKAKTALESLWTLFNYSFGINFISDHELNERYFYTVVYYWTKFSKPLQVGLGSWDQVSSYFFVINTSICLSLIMPYGGLST